MALEPVAAPCRGPMEELQAHWVWCPWRRAGGVLQFPESWLPWLHGPSSSHPPSPPAQDSPRPTFSRSAFCQRRKMRRKQRSRAPKEVKKCCRRERGVSPGGETRLEGGGSSTRCTLFPALHADVCIHSPLHSFHRISVLCPAQHWMTLESPR